MMNETALGWWRIHKDHEYAVSCPYCQAESLDVPPRQVAARIAGSALENLLGDAETLGIANPGQLTTETLVEKLFAIEEGRDESI